MEIPTTRRTFSREEKQQLLDNLEIELVHRTRRLEGELADALEKFLIRQEGHISRMPRLVRAMPLREFRDKYHGDVKAALRGIQMEKLGVAGEGEGPFGEIDKSTRKRKWVASIEVEGDVHANNRSGSGTTEAESSRAPKNARTMHATPKKKHVPPLAPGPAQRARLQAATSDGTPRTSRTMGRTPFASPSPQKQPKSHAFPRRPLSPTKPTTAGVNQNRPPSATTFAPVLPKAPAFPALGTTRLPRRDETMLSLNGSPLANPFDLGLGWFTGLTSGDEDGEETDGNLPQAENARESGEASGRPRLKKASSKINIRRDPSTTYSHSRTTSQSSIAASSSSSTLHSRSNSNHPIPAIHGQADPSIPKKPLFPSSHAPPIAAMFSLPTSDGHLLEFDPLQTSPGQLEALDGITDSAKRGVREEMGRLIKLAVERWKVG